jgi:hypothetical protein
MKLTPAQHRVVADELRIRVESSFTKSGTVDAILLRAAEEHERLADEAEAGELLCVHVEGRIWLVGTVEQPVRQRLSPQQHHALHVAVAAFQAPGELIDPAPLLSPKPLSLAALQTALCRLRERLAAHLPVLEYVSLQENGFAVYNPPPDAPRIQIKM